MELGRRLRKPPPLERKPTMLKDFLRDDFSSCSSNGFHSYPRRQPSLCYTSVRALLETDLKLPTPTPKLKPLPSKSRFQKASSAVINVVKQFQLSHKKGILGRSLSKRLKRSFTKKTEERVHVIRVKDILTWKLVQETPRPKQITIDHCPTTLTTNTTATTPTTTTSATSWSDSDFSSGSSGSWDENEANQYDCKKYLQQTKENSCIEDSIKSHGESKYDDKDQSSPVSVLDFPFEEDDDSSSSFQSSLENMERAKHKLMSKIKRFENLAKIEPLNLDKRITTLEQDGSSYPSDDDEEEEEEDKEYIKAGNKAIELLKLFNQTSSNDQCLTDTTNDLLLDFFRDEILEKRHSKRKSSKGDHEFDYELLKVAKEWMVGKNVLLDWQVEESRQVHIKEMERGGQWGQVEQEEMESTMELEVGVLNLLIDEMISDLLS